MQTVYLIRHATPDWDRKDLIYHEPPGPPLTSQGLEEADALGEFLAAAGVHRLYTSPLERCQHTAQIVSEVTQAPLEDLPQLTEWRPGEDMAAVRERMWPAFQRLAQESECTGPVAAITHGGPITALLKALGMDETTLSQHKVYDHSNPVPPAGVWKVSRENCEDPWQLELIFVPDQGITADD